ncbi:hypothetical protein GCM10023149_09080 [Mucilaginibacter gynuensis]|uniref:Alpha-L-rhamnosidase six-hairpin glycosidase domain-containing protein n=1 Tax=Mucilaginibacter gynuensis TaxID=1302236 RepID=A0ABP8FY05_9SPHI
MTFKAPLFAFLILLYAFQPAHAAEKAVPGIINNTTAKEITISTPDKNLSIVIDYSTGCVVKKLSIKGKNVLSASGIYTGLRIGGDKFSSAEVLNNIKVTNNTQDITLSNISYTAGVKETWGFKLNGDKIVWNITRDYATDLHLEDMAFPKWNFANLNVWKGGIIDNGGMVWCKYLKEVNDTYGVHTGGITFWNAETGNGLRIAPHIANGKSIASAYSHSPAKEFTFTQLLTDAPLKQRYNLNRFVAQKADVFAPFDIKKGTATVSYELQYIDYGKEYSKGELPGIDATVVRELMNTTGRYGVVDNTIVGANGWLTNWKCLHEPFFAQIGMALNDSNYTANMASNLNRERDVAMLPDGRILSRWHNEAGDEIPGTYNAETGYYEAMWGYTIDSQTGYVINASEQFDLTGDVEWLRTHQSSCEKALDWLITRDSNNNGLVEMMNNNIAEKKASDWLDIVWASFENSFVNAQLYEALTLWTNCESILGNKEKAKYYAAVAQRLKTAFNKPVEQGGFWLASKQQYVYWRDNDGSVHGDNLVTPINFAAIAFGLCDDADRKALILDQIEKRADAEHLFHWPLCFDSFRKEEVSGGNWPFPKYENGDIFPTWGYLGIRAYAQYDKAIALKYISNLIEQYKKDGLSSQRYSRTTQLGLGDDILAGICTSITALYRDIYGIRPKWNRMGLEPNLLAKLNGTEFKYKHLGTLYTLNLSVNNYVMRSNGFTISSKAVFGANKTGNTLSYYPNNAELAVLKITATTKKAIDVKIIEPASSTLSWSINSADTYQITLQGLQPASAYTVLINNRAQNVKTDTKGSFSIKITCKGATHFVVKRL